MNPILLFTLLLFSLSLYADVNTSRTSPQNTPPAWKAGFESHYFNFEGERPQEKGDYEFGDTTLKMQLISLQFQVNPEWTVLGIVPYYENNVVTLMFGKSYQDTTRGVGDLTFSALNTQLMSPNFIVMTDVGLSLPTGSIDEINPNRRDQARYPYNMQLGSGTVDGIVGMTPLWIEPGFQVGGRFSGIFRTTGYNANGYRLGHQYKAEAWWESPLGTSGWSPRLSGYYKHRNGIDGQDSTLSSSLDRRFLEYYYHDQINWDVSVSLKYSKALSPRLTLKAEGGVPLAQDCVNYDDVAIFTESFASLGLTGSF